MSDKSELLHVPQEDSALVLSETRSSLIARARKDAASLVMRKAGPEYLAIAGVNGKSGFRIGFIDRGGQFVINPIYYSAGSFSCGRALFSASPISYGADGRGEGTFGYLDTNGKVAIEPQFKRASHFSDGYAAVEVNEKWGLIDKRGTLVIEPCFEAVHDFQEGLAAVRLDGKYGFINQSGKFIIQPSFDEVSGFSGGLASVRVKRIGDEDEYSEIYFIEKSGNIAFKWPETEEVFSDFIDGTAVVQGPCNLGCICGAEDEGLSCESNYTYYVDKFGKPLSNKYAMSALGSFSNGRGIISLPVDSDCQPGRYLFGYIDRNGRIEIQNEIPFRICIENGSELSDEEWELIGEVDESVRISEFDRVYDFHEGLARVVINGKYGFIDVRGEIVIEPTFLEARDFKNGMALVSDKEWLGEWAKWGFIDRSGKAVIPIQFNSAGNFERIVS